MGGIPKSVIIFALQHGWPIPNYNNPVTRGLTLVIINLLMMGATMLVVFLRIYTRVFISKYFGNDDILMVMALLTCLAMNSLSAFQGLRYDFDRHVWDMHYDNFKAGFALNIPIQCTFAIAACFTKLSALTFLWRLRGLGRDWTCISMMILCLISGTVFPLMCIFQCRPISAYWDFSNPKRECLNASTNIIVWSFYNTCTDFMVVCLPIYIFCKLAVPLKQKILLCLLFGLSSIVCIAGLCRIVFTCISAKALDSTWQSYPVWLLNTTELDIGIICASAPALKPLLCHWFEEIPGESNSRPTLGKPLENELKLKQCTASEERIIGAPSFDGSEATHMEV